MMDRLVGSARFIVLLGVVSSIFLSATLFVTATVRTFSLIATNLASVGSDKSTKTLAIAAIEQADIFLIATALLIVGIGLHELFIGKISQPEWLVIKSLDDLKDKLTNVVVVVLAVNFLAQVSNWDGQTNLLPLGLAIGAVILALSAFALLRSFKKGKNGDSDDA